MKKLLDIFIKKGIEKAILLIAILLFMAYFVLAFILGDKDKELDALSQESKALNTAIETATTTETGNLVDTYSNTLITWYWAPSSMYDNKWVFYRYPDVKPEGKPKESTTKIRVKSQVLATPNISNITAQVGKIFLGWVNTFASDEYVTILPSSYRIERKTEGEKEYKTIATVSAMNYTDINIQPKTVYHYRIAPLSDKLKAEEVSEEKSIKSAGVFTIIFNGTAGNEIWIKVIKFDTSMQKQFEKSFRVKKNEEIGKKDQIPDSPKVDVKIDFNTGYIAKRWNEEKVKVSDLICKNPANANHQPGKGAPRDVKVVSFTYIDDENNEKKVWLDDKEPQGLDNRCPKHKNKQ